MSYYFSEVTSKWNGQRYTTFSVVPHWYNDDAPTAHCKGDNTAATAEAQQQQFDAQMMGIFNEQFGKQSKITDFLTAKMKPIINSGGTGYSPEALAALRTTADTNITGQFQNAQRALQEREFSTGGRDLPSGVNAQLDAGLYAQEASDRSSASNNITLQNENLRQQNYWNALNVLNGQASTLNPLGYAGAATSGTNAVANASQAVTAANQSQLMGALGGIVGGAASGLAGNPGLFKGCWIAAACYDESFYAGPKTNLVRNYLWSTWNQHWYAKPVLALYSKYGKQISEQPVLVSLLRPVFNIALRRAQEIQ